MDEKVNTMTAQSNNKNSVVYEIYVKSFCDSDGDGLGDLPGITSKLDYLANLGVDYLWLTPFYPSPQRDNGYDVSDYCAVDPRYGTMEDFDELVAAARERGMGIMLDMVLCHTSNQHEWFQRALAGEERYQRYYILRDGKGSMGPGDPGEPPTNWQCVFGGSAWEWEPRLGKWYLHMHDSSQPDVDWTNPDVRDEMAGVVRFWKERGVTGFRFDVINLISKPEVIEDVPGDGSACRALVADGPHVHEYLKELVERSGIDGMATVGEMASTGLENCIRYTNPDEHELGMTNADYTSIEQFDDVESHNNYRILLEGGSSQEEALRAIQVRSRDNGRTPMQWTAGENAGFTCGTPWLAVPANHVRINAEDEVGAKGSMYEFYRELIALRKGSRVLADGTVHFLDTGSEAPKVIVFERVLGSERVVAICSFDSEGCTVDADSLGIAACGDVLLSTHGGVGKLADGALALRPYEALLIAC